MIMIKMNYVRKLWTTTIFQQQGFTFIELVIVIAIISLILGIVSVNIFQSQRIVSITTQSDTLISRIKTQQIKAMTGDTQGKNTADSYGIYFEQNRYILFRGASYSPSDTANIVVNLGDNLEFSPITLPSSVVIFRKGSGEVVSFVQGANTITIKNKFDNRQKTIHVNRYGVITQEE